MIQTHRIPALLARSAVLVSAALVGLRASATGLFDDTFRPVFEGNPGLVLALDAFELKDGRILAVGAFETVNGRPARAMVRLQSDGSSDPTWNTGAGFEWENGIPALVTCAAELRDGRIVAGGFFSMLDGKPVPGLVSLHPDGTRDQTFDVGAGPEAPTFGKNPVMGVYELQDGKLLVQGYFERWNGQPRRGVVRLHPDGKVDESFAPVIEPTLESPLSLGLVGALEGNRYLISTVYDTEFKNLVEVNGTRLAGGLFVLDSAGQLDTTLRFGQGPDRGSLFPTRPTPDGGLMVFGQFRAFDGQERSHLAHLRRDGSVDPEFVPPVLRGNESLISDEALVVGVLPLPDGRWIAMGAFDQADQRTNNCLVRLLPNGTLDRTFDIGRGVQAEDGTHGAVTGLRPLRSGKYLMSGMFETFDGVVQRALVRLDPEGGMAASSKFTLDAVRRLPNGEAEVRFTQRKPGPLVVEVADTPGVWTELTRHSGETGSHQVIDPAAASRPSRFYRLRGE